MAYAVGGTIVLWRWDDATYVYARADRGRKARRGQAVPDSGDGWVSDLALTPDDLYLVSAHDNPQGLVSYTRRVGAVYVGGEAPG